MTGTESWRLRRYRDGDEAAINSGFNEVFGLQRSIAEWNWKFAAAGPHGRSIALAVEPAGGVLAHFAALPVEVQLDGRRLWAGQSVDDYCRARQGLGRNGLYVNTVRWFYRELGGAEGLAFLYGFPGERHLRLGRTLLGYLPPVPVTPLRWTIAPLRRPPWSRWRSEPEPDLAEVEALWRRAAVRYPCAVVRERAYLERRYRGRPGVEYRGIGVRRSGRLAAWSVVRQEGATSRWVDLVWDGEDVRALATLHRAAAAHGIEAGARDSELWLGGDPQAVAALTGLGWRAAPHPQGLGLTMVGLREGLELVAVLPRFYFTLGDSDLA